MSNPWTADKIIALAPDPASAKAGKDLATPRKWVTLGTDDRCAWGLCQGSGSKPYQAQIDLSEPAFKCSCPSRKFPCKHSLGLFLLLVSQESAFKDREPPAWVNEWLAGRSKRKEQKEKKAEAPAEPPDPAAQARRIAERESNILAGAQELSLRLQDLVRSGLAAAQAQPSQSWQSVASRMVDSQAPGLATMARKLGQIPSSGNGWQGRMLAELARIHLIVEGFTRKDRLPENTQADLRSLAGWPRNQEELLQQPGVRDVWAVVGQTTDVEDRLRVLRTWLVGRQSRRPALILQFAHGTAGFGQSLLLGTEMDAELVFYPGGWPLRALLKTRHAEPRAIGSLAGFADIGAAMEGYAEALAHFPWLEDFPMLLEAVTPAGQEDRWEIQDAGGKALPLSPRFARGWQLMALSGGGPVSVFGLWDGQGLSPLSAVSDEGFVVLQPVNQSHECVG